MTTDARTTEIANTLAKLASLMAEQNNEGPSPSTDTGERDDSKRVLLTVEEAAKRLNIGRTKTYALVRSGQIASVRIGRLRRVPAEAIEDYATRLTSDQTAA